MTSLEDLPTDLHRLILDNDAEKEALKKRVAELEENEKRLNLVIDDFADHLAMTTSWDGYHPPWTENKKDLFGEFMERPNITELGDKLFAQAKSYGHTGHANDYKLASAYGDKEGEDNISDVWCIADLRSIVHIMKTGGDPTHMLATWIGPN